ncbi:uncharacterized protein Dvir_GJ20641 [Drosophila virilis]|uniref:Uncharacterized protein n=1 Tax=Drosophila virilis TaxID=7244 RepID=B4LL98_DROVI|nr:uncharacterized protein Dvir_GJ20641 [Drosophila virilis]
MLPFPKRCGVGNIISVARLGSLSLTSRPVRHYSDKEECKPVAASTCGLVLNEYTCGLKPTKMYVPKPKVTRPPLVSMWKIENCEPDLCTLDLRYDMKYYRISDKKKRKYQVTWNECPRLLVKPRKVCLYEKMVRPKIERRKHAKVLPVPQVAKSCIALLAKDTCVYVKAPCCKVGRRPPKCRAAFPTPGQCEKRKTPYPSFSECQKDAVIPLPPAECKCLSAFALCDAWAVLRRRIARGQTPAKKCGEA